MSYKRIKLVEFEISAINSDMELATKFFKGVAQFVLHQDNHWHFFYEGEYSLIRCSEKYASTLEEFLKETHIPYINKGIWIDGSKYIEKYKKMFIPILHNYTLLSLSLDENDLFLVSDRICHSFFNHCTYAVPKLRKMYGEHSWESFILSQLLIDRAEYIGRLKLNEQYIKSSISMAQQNESTTKQGELKCCTM